MQSGGETRQLPAGLARRGRVNASNLPVLSHESGKFVSTKPEAKLERERLDPFTLSSDSDCASYEEEHGPPSVQKLPKICKHNNAPYSTEPDDLAYSLLHWMMILHTRLEVCNERESSSHRLEHYEAGVP